MADLDHLLREDGAAWRAHVDTKRPEIHLEDEPRPAEPARAHRWRAPLLAAAVVLLIAATTSVILVRETNRGTHAMTSESIELSGRWVVTRIKVGSSKPIIVPRYQGADFVWTPAGPRPYLGRDGKMHTKHFGPSLDATDGVSSYASSYTRDGNQLTLRDVVVAPNVLEHATNLQRKVTSAFDDAFRNEELTVTSPAERELDVALGETRFILVKVS